MQRDLFRLPRTPWNSGRIISAAQAYNHTPRQCLDFQTPAEVFSEVLCFEWESTSRHAPG